ncbi:MAG: hypothetical protein JHC98_02975 [Thermoleophilaceae bacterium]|nr:hypothetical protein [Thermoleophilaceae bacterium]
MLSIFLFVVSYRQTIGARKERARGAKHELEAVLTKRYLAAVYDPEPEDIRRLIEASASRHRVRLADMPTVDLLLSSLELAVLENDFVGDTERQDALQRLGRILEQSAKEAEQPVAIAAPNVSRTDRSIDIGVAERTSRRLVWALAAGTVTAGTAAAGAFAGGTSETLTDSAVGLSIAISGASVAFLAAIFRLADRDESDGIDYIGEAQAFDESVRRRLRDASTGLEATTGDGAVDWIVGDARGRIGIQTMFAPSTRPPSRRRIWRRLDELREAKRDMGLDEVLLVLPEIPRKKYDIHEGWIRITDPSGMAEFVRRVLPADGPRS